MKRRQAQGGHELCFTRVCAVMGFAMVLTSSLTHAQTNERKPYTDATYSQKSSDKVENVYMILPGIKSDDDAKDVEKIKVALTCVGEFYKANNHEKQKCFLNLQGSLVNRGRNIMPIQSVSITYDLQKDGKPNTSYYLLSKKILHADPISSSEIYCDLQSDERSYGRGDSIQNGKCEGQVSDLDTVSFSVFATIDSIVNAKELCPNVFVRDGKVMIHRIVIQNEIRGDEVLYAVLRIK